MENFKKLLEKKNIDDISIFLKNSDVDLLRSIAKRYKIPASTKKKELIISSVLQAINSDHSFGEEPPIHTKTISQLKQKAREINIDFSNLHGKQALRLAIIKKMKQNEKNDAIVTQVEAVNNELTNEYLQSKSVQFLKALAKKYDIKISKLSKNQLIAQILSNQMVGEVPKSLDIGQKPISKLKKNELIVMAEEMGLDPKGKDKNSIMKMIQEKMGGGAEISFSSTTTSRISKSKKDMTEKVVEITEVPISMDMMEVIKNDRRYTISKVKEILKKFKMKIPRGVVKRDDLMMLLTTKFHNQKEKETTVTDQLPKSSQQQGQKTTMNSNKTKTSRKQAEIISQTVIQTPAFYTQSTKRRKTPTTSDIVSLDDIQSPFSPVPVGDLLEEPTEKQLQEELYRCLEFYEYPK